jgi:hypothetical protein
MRILMRFLPLFLAALLSGALVYGATKYSGPRPPKADVLYLLHADNLVETEVVVAKEETRKDASVATIPGASSSAKTPLAEPIFLLKSNQLLPGKLAAYKFEVKNGVREVVISHKKQKNVAKPIHLSITRLDENLYRVEIDEPLENGEYTISPEGSNDTFNFQIY